MFVCQVTGAEKGVAKGAPSDPSAASTAASARTCDPRSAFRTAYVSAKASSIGSSSNAASALPPPSAAAAAPPTRARCHATCRFSSATVESGSPASRKVAPTCASPSRNTLEPGVMGVCGRKPVGVAGKVGEKGERPLPSNALGTVIGLGALERPLAGAPPSATTGTSVLAVRIIPTVPSGKSGATAARRWHPASLAVAV
mmetsp:Transcript_7996/g.26579  ORF Transcript_7996/g.26579 Transcript_7996/m.26579 type:complete len:200 (-) Transcript_7996:263-862(-)